MKYIKMLGLAVVAAMAFMAFVGATSASATVLCKTSAATTDCASTGWDYPAGTKIVATSTNAVLTSGAEPVTCEHSVVEGTTENTGSVTETVTSKGEINITFTNCNHTVDVIKPGTLEIHHVTGANSTLTSKGASITVSIFGITCTYGTPAGGLKVGEYTNEAGVIDIDVNVEKKEGGFLCPSSPTWEGTYTVTSPTPLYISES